GILPLLCVSRTEVEEFLPEREQKFVTDSTKSDTDMTRNFIRIRMLPLIKELNPSADRAVLRLSDSAREDEEYFINEAKKLPRGASLGYLKSVPSPILKRYIRLCFEEAVKEGAQLDYGSLEAICGDIRNGVSRFRYSVCGNIAVIGDGGRLEFIADKVTPKPFCFTVDTVGEYRTECGTVFVTEDEEDVNAWTDANQGAVFTAYPIDGDGWSFTVRSALPGDRYLRGGMHREVRKELNAFGYPPHKRASLPRFCDGDGIFWVPYLPAGDKTGQAAEKTRTVLSREPKKAKKAEKEIYKQLIYIGYTEN
ncbi:MAG: hypothetical protein IJY04_06830, partial [Clostridia bacterium]|nr:hypothetical protein [Clostridia bacterium]